VKSRNGVQAESRQVRILPLSAIRPSSANNQIYRPITDADVADLAVSITEHGLREPIVVTSDNVILSGHRRYCAARLAGLKEVPCRIEDITSDDVRFLPLLTAYNEQRVKSLDEFMREAIVNTDPHEAYQSLIDFREKKGRIDTGSLQSIQLRGVKTRAAISGAKEAMLRLALMVIEANRPYWPLTVRQIHYRLLNDPPLRHSSKPDSVYCNNRNCYCDLCDLLARARLENRLAWEAITDETRPVVTESGFRNPQHFIKQEIDNFLRGYSRNLLQSQPNFIQIVGEKMTIQGVIHTVWNKYGIPYTIGRGYCALDPRRRLVESFLRSKKAELILLVLSDYDPDGVEIAHSFARSLRDDFGIEQIRPIQVALTAAQIEEFALPPIMTAKNTSAHYQRFIDEHGDDAVYELEALQPAQLEKVLTDAIDSVLDVDAFNAEIAQEKTDAAFLEAKRRSLFEYLQQAGFNPDAAI
jgi:ParB-like nuclease family protein